MFRLVWLSVGAEGSGTRAFLFWISDFGFCAGGCGRIRNLELEVLFQREDEHGTVSARLDARCCVGGGLLA